MAIGPNPEFAWSVSRAGLFGFCPRKYFHRYHGMWGGWKDSAAEKTRLTYLLSRRTSLAGWAGLEVHRAISLYIHSERSMEEVLSATRERMRGQFRLSRAKQFLRPGQAKTFGLAEHYYDADLSDDEVRARWEQVAACLEAFAASHYRSDLIDARGAKRLAYAERPDEDDFAFMGFSGHGLGDFRIFAHPDFVITYPDGTTCILDWKTGLPPREGEDRVTDQLGFYALWTAEKLGLALDADDLQLEAYEVYWPREETRGDRLTRDHLDAALAFARDSVSSIRDRLADAQANLAREQDFEATGTAAKCAICEFRAVCDDRVGG